MNKMFVIAAAVVSLSAVSCRDAQDVAVPRLTGYVDPFIGTDGHGHVFLGANVPFGGVHLGPSNTTQGWDWCSGYHYSDSIVKGFAHTHLSGTGIGDLGDIVFMPVTGEVTMEEEGYVSKYSHDDETARPGYYSVLLDRYGITAELTATERCGVHRYSYPEGTASAGLVVDLESGIGWDAPVAGMVRKVDDRTIAGYRYSTGWATDQRVYFFARFSQPMAGMRVFDDGVEVLSDEAEGVRLRALLSFGEVSQLVAEVGISAVSCEGARLNCLSELDGRSFDEVADDADGKWNRYLAKMQVEGGRDDDRRAFYTALYHTAFAPQLFNDADGSYRGADGATYRDTSRNVYTVYSLWDTYRAADPLYTVIEPERTGEFVDNFLKIYDQQGRLPVWHLAGNETNCMVGYHSIPVIAMAYLRGIGGFDTLKAYEAARSYAELNERGLDHIRSIGYIPSDKEPESVAKALEYAVDDWAVAQMAARMGMKDDYDRFMARSRGYARYFDKGCGFMRGRRSDGNWSEGFDPVLSRHRDDDYCEGNAWQYVWMVPHDVEGLVALFGSEEAFEAKLDSLFVVEAELGDEASPDISGLIGQYAQGNEPNHSTPFLYNYIGRQWKSAELSRRIMRSFFDDTPAGLCGNEDAGQMSAWYVLAATGLYPANAVSGAFVLASPLFDKATVDVGGGRKVTVEAVGNSEDNIYVQRAELDGCRYDKSYITYDDIMSGGVLRLVMGPEPNRDFGASKDARPRSKVY